MDLSVFAERLRTARDELGFTQAELATESGVKRSTLNNWEQGRSYPEVTQLVRLCKALGVDAEFLLGLEAELDKSSSLAKARSRKAYLEKELIYCEPRRRRAVAESLARVERRIEVYNEMMRKGRSLTFSGTPDSKIPLLKFTQSDAASHVEEVREGEIAVPPGIQADFAIRVKGDSMTGFCILDGDIVLCRRPDSEPPIGHIILAIIGDSDAKLRHLLLEGSLWLLRAAHPCYADVTIRPDNNIIKGVSVMILRDIDRNIDSHQLPLLELVSKETGVPVRAIRAFLAAYASSEP